MKNKTINLMLIFLLFLWNGMLRLPFTRSELPIYQNKVVQQLIGLYKELYEKGKEASWKPSDHREDHTGQSNLKQIQEKNRSINCKSYC